MKQTIKDYIETLEENVEHYYTMMSENLKHNLTHSYFTWVGMAQAIRYVVNDLKEMLDEFEKEAL